MPTFILKKYDIENKDTLKNDTENKEQDSKNDKEIYINVSNSIAEIIYDALNKALTDSDITIVNDDKDTDIKAISTEDINTDAINTFNHINKNDIIYINSNGFKTDKDNWFLLNIGNKTDKVFYTIESFVNYIKHQLK